MARHRPPAVGVDFGTSTSLVARRVGAGPVEILPIGETRRWLPSLAGLRDGRLVVGEEAENLAPDNIVRSIKSAITNDRQMVPLGPGGSQVSRDEVVTAIFREVAQRTKERGLSLRRQRDLRLGCPAMWTREQRQLVLNLASVAGLPVDAATLVEEPVAAGLAWLSSQYVDPNVIDGRLLVFDIGGGTLDIAVVDVVGGNPPDIAVLTSVGLPIAGDALDEAIARDMRAELVELGVELHRLRKPEHAEAEILRQAREAKLALSVTASHTVVFARAAFAGRKVPTMRYGRERLEEVFRPQMAAAETKVWDALRLARLTHHRGGSPQEIFATSTDELARDVDYLLLAGGMSRIPYVRRRLAELLPKAELFESVGVAADETVVAGLTDTSGADPINLYRPGFDFVLTWDDGQALPLYEAYTPLFEMNQLYRGSDASFSLSIGPRQGIPRQRQGELSVSTPAGHSVNLIRMDKFGQQHIIDRLPVPFGFYDLYFRLYCDGRVHLTDGAGHDHKLRVEPWPVIHGADSGPEPEQPPDPPLHYPFNRP